MVIDDQHGAIWPHEYDYAGYFTGVLKNSDENGNVLVGADNIRGILAAFAMSQDTVGELVRERSDMMKLIGQLATENAALKQDALNMEPRKIQIGDRVVANQTAGFHKGAEGVVQFVEPNYEKVWVLRDRSSGPVFYHPSELDVLVEVDNVEVAKE